MFPLLTPDHIWWAVWVLWVAAISALLLWRTHVTSVNGTEIAIFAIATVGSLPI
jgi:hypothetical protein